MTCAPPDTDAVAQRIHGRSGPSAQNDSRCRRDAIDDQLRSGFFREDTHLEQSTAFDLSELLQTIIDDYRDQDISIDFTGPAHLVYDGRPLGIKRVIVNLLENAVKYGQNPRTALSCDDHSIRIEVSDDGPGIPEAALQRVFDPFFRLETSRNRDTGGVGLGLSAARAIVREQGGELTLSNRSDAGLVARVELPRHDHGLFK